MISASAPIRTKSQASLAIRIEANRIGSATAAVASLATDGGRLADFDFDLLFGGWSFKFQRRIDLLGCALSHGRVLHESALPYHRLATARGSAFNPPKRRPRC